MAMAKAKKRLSKALAAVFTAFTLLSMAPAAYAGTPAKGLPDLKITQQPAAEYKVGDRITFKVQAPNYGGLVEYRVAVWNKEIGMRDLFQDKDSKAKGYWYQPWKTAGTYERSITWVISGDNWPVGDYQLVTYVRRNGQKTYEDYETVQRFKIVKDAPVAEATVVSVANPADVTVNEGDAFTAPATVKATMSDNTTKDVAVTWDKTVDTKVVGDYVLSATVEGKAVSFKVSVKAVALKVNSVAAVKANTLKVTFNKAVDTTKAVFAVKKDSSVVAMNAATWNDAKTEATLVKSSGKFYAGDYTVAVSGVEIASADSSKVVTLKDQTVTNIEFLGSSLVKKADKASATFRYIVKDQYGEDMTKGTDLSKVSSLVASDKISLDDSKGLGTITYEFDELKNLNVPKTVTVTLFDAKSGVSKSATLDVASTSNVAELTFGDVKLPEDYDRVEAGMPVGTDITIALTAKDQYGNKLTKAELDAATRLIPSTSDIAPVWAEDADKNAVIKFNTNKIADETTIVINVVSTADGKAFNKSIQIFKAAEAKVVRLGDITAETIAAGDKDIVLPITVVDQFGNELTAKQIVAQKDKVEKIVTSSNTGVITNPTVVTDRNDKNYGKMIFEAKADGSAMIISSSTTAGVVTKSIKVEKTRKLAEVIAPATVNLIQGATKDIEFKFLDQYGKEIDRDKLADTADMSYTVKLEKVSGDDNAVTTDEKDASTAESELKYVSVKSDAKKTGSYKVTVKLYDKTFAGDPLVVEGKVLSEATVTVNVVKNNVADVTYGVDPIVTIVGSADLPNDTASPYAKQIKVTAKNATGTTYTVNPGDIIAVSSSDEEIVKVGKVAGKWYVFGQDVTKKADNTKNTEDKKATVTVKLNTLDGLKVVTSEVTVSPKAAEAKELRVVDAAIDANGKAVVFDDLDVNDKLTYVIAKSADLTTLNVIALDQYGVWNNVDLKAASEKATIVVNSTDLAPYNAFTFDANGKLALNTAADAQMADKVSYGKDIKATIISGDITVQITLNVTAK